MYEGKYEIAVSTLVSVAWYIGGWLTATLNLKTRLNAKNERDIGSGNRDLDSLFPSHICVCAIC